MSHYQCTFCSVLIYRLQIQLLSIEGHAFQVLSVELNHHFMRSRQQVSAMTKVRGQNVMRTNCQRTKCHKIIINRFNI